MADPTKIKIGPHEFPKHQPRPMTTNTPSPGPTGNTPFENVTVVGDEPYSQPQPRSPQQQGSDE